MKYIKLFEDEQYRQKSYNKLYDAIFDFLETEGGYELENDYFTAPVGGMMDMLKIMGKKTTETEPTFLLMPSPIIKFWRFYASYNLKELGLQFLAPIEIFNFLIEKLKHILYEDDKSIHINNKNWSFAFTSE